MPSGDPSSSRRVAAESRISLPVYDPKIHVHSCMLEFASLDMEYSVEVGFFSGSSAAYSGSTKRTVVRTMPTSRPMRFAFLADVGFSYRTFNNFNHMVMDSGDGIKTDVVLLVGDMAYGNPAHGESCVCRRAGSRAMTLRSSSILPRALLAVGGGGESARKRTRAYTRKQLRARARKGPVCLRARHIRVSTPALSTPQLEKGDLQLQLPHIRMSIYAHMHESTDLCALCTHPSTCACVYSSWPVGAQPTTSSSSTRLRIRRRLSHSSAALGTTKITASSTSCRMCSCSARRTPTQTCPSYGTARA